MTATVIRLLVKASTQGHDENRLRTEWVERFQALWRRLPFKPYLSPRLHKLTENPMLIKPMDAAALVDAMGEVIGREQNELSDDLLALTLVVARLGGLSSAMKIGLLAVEELRARRATPKRSIF